MVCIWVYSIFSFRIAKIVEALELGKHGWWRLLFSIKSYIEWNSSYWHNFIKVEINFSWNIRGKLNDSKRTIIMKEQLTFTEKEIKVRDFYKTRTIKSLQKRINLSIIIGFFYWLINKLSKKVEFDLINFCWYQLIRFSKNLELKWLWNIIAVSCKNSIFFGKYWIFSRF